MTVSFPKLVAAIARIFTPLGWGDWKMAVAAVTGLIAKENVVGTFGILLWLRRGC